MRLLYICMALLVVGCGNVIEVTGVYSVAASTQPLVDSFMNEWDRRTGRRHVVRNLIVTIATDDSFDSDSHLGTCMLAVIPIIELRRSTWIKMKPARKEALLFHELGHCLLGQGHRPGTLMDPYLLTAENYSANREYYLEEMFSHEIRRSKLGRK
jgi:hypothetical protein